MNTALGEPVTYFNERSALLYFTHTRVTSHIVQLLKIGVSEIVVYRFNITDDLKMSRFYPLFQRKGA